MNFLQHVSVTKIFLSKSEKPFQPLTVKKTKHFLMYQTRAYYSTYGNLLPIKKMLHPLHQHHPLSCAIIHLKGLVVNTVYSANAYGILYRGKTVMIKN